MGSWFIPLVGISLTALLFLREGLNKSENEGIISDRKTVKGNEICNTKECRQVANAFVESMNKSVNPCDDFYEFVCGNWRSENPAPKYESQWSSTKRFEILAEARLRDELESEPSSEDILPIQYAKKIYRSCVNNEAREAEGLQKISAILQETKGWPMTMNTWNSQAITWQEIDQYHENLIGIRGLFHIDTEPDNLSERTRLTLERPYFPLQVQRFILNYTSDGVIAYRSVIKNIARLFIQQNGENVSDKKLNEDINDLLKFEETLYEINWEMILQNAYTIAKPPMTDNTTEIHLNIKYLIELPKILDSTDERTIVNYIQWQFVSLMLRFTTEEVNHILSKISENVDGVQERHPSWLQCVRDVSTMPAGAYLFARKYYTNKSKAAVDKMTENLRKSFEFQINNSNWLPIEAKQAAIKKLNSMLVFSGYPEWYNNETALIKYYENLTLGTSYIENLIKNDGREWRERISHWGKSIDNQMWSMNVLDVNAYYSLKSNVIYIPAAHLQPPLFDGNMPDYILYGIVGCPIGHEMSHGFDDKGIGYGIDPGRKLFADDVMAMYDEHVKCFVETYDRYSRDDTKNNRNESRGALTLSENLADWSGLQAVFHAYKEIQDNVPNEELKFPGLEEFSDDEMFFISYAQYWCEAELSDTYKKNVAIWYTHAAAKFRVIGLLSNILEFAETFNCPINSPMNPEKKCNIWTNSSVASS